MRTKTCFVWTGLTSPGILLHACVVCRPTLLGKSIHSQAGQLPGGRFQHTPTQGRGSGETWDGLVYAGPSYCFLLLLHAYACGCVWRERESGRENERTRERTRERKRDGPSLLSGSIQLIQFNASSSLSMDLGAPATRRCGLARGGPPSAAQCVPATAGTRRASEAWQPRGHSPESLLEETNQAS